MFEISGVVLYGTKRGCVFLMSMDYDKGFLMRNISRAILFIPTRLRCIMSLRISIRKMERREI